MDRKSLKKVLLFIGLFMLFTQVAGADGIPNMYRPINEPFNIAYDKEGGAAILILQIIAGGLLYFAAPIAIIMIGIAGWQLVTGGAESEKIEQGKKHLFWSIAGLLVIILSFSIVKFLITFSIKSASVPSAPAADLAPTTTFEEMFTPQA